LLPVAAEIVVSTEALYRESGTCEPTACRIDMTMLRVRTH
jgi:hypothetical protein